LVECHILLSNHDRGTHLDQVMFLCYKATVEVPQEEKLHG